jgi:ribosomal protein S18 acetylase RimI-like enzyme
VLEFPGVLGSWVERVSDPWLNTLVPDGPEVDLSAALGALEHTGISVFTCSPGQAEAAVAAGFGELVARQPAMGLDFPVEGEAPADIDTGVDLAALGALSDVAYGNTRGELEHTLHRLPAGELHAYGRRGDDGTLLSAGLVYDCDDDCTVQYVATLPTARRAGYAEAVMRRALADAAARGARTATLTASEQGRPLYERLGFRVLGELELRRRPR